MGTRADFYVGRGPHAEWIGSLAFDGDPRSIQPFVLSAHREDDFRAEVATHLLDNDPSATTPDQGWPWPWADSRTTDYAYAFDGGTVYVSRFGSPWWSATEEEPRDPAALAGAAAVFPDMSSRRAVAPAGSDRSGTIAVGVQATVTPAALVALAIEFARELVARGWSAHLAREIETAAAQPFGPTLLLFADRLDAAAGPSFTERYFRARAAADAARLAAHLQSLAQRQEVDRG